MRHQKSGRKFGRNTSHRRAMLRALAANLVAHESIVTTEAKAKELRRVVERLITKAKRLGELAYTKTEGLSAGDVARRHAAKQQVGQFLRRFGTVEQGDYTLTVDLVEKVFVELAQRFATRPGGYTRITKLGPRRGDNAPMTLIQFVDYVPTHRGAAPAADEAEPAESADDARVVV